MENNISEQIEQAVNFLKNQFLIPRYLILSYGSMRDLRKEFHYTQNDVNEEKEVNINGIINIRGELIKIKNPEPTLEGGDYIIACRKDKDTIIEEILFSLRTMEMRKKQFVNIPFKPITKEKQTPPKEIYILEQSFDDGKTWKVVTQFEKGQRSRFDVPFDANVAVKEAQSFLANWRRNGFNKPTDFRVKITINIEI